MYGEDGKFSETLQSLIRDVKESSAKAGFYQMCVPEALGGGGFRPPRLLCCLASAIPPLRTKKLAYALLTCSLGLRA